jgi:hypothetical protein
MVGEVSFTGFWSLAIDSVRPVASAHIGTGGVTEEAKFIGYGSRSQRFDGLPTGHFTNSNGLCGALMAAHAVAVSLPAVLRR